MGSKSKWVPKWIRRTFPNGDGERFAVAPTRNRKKNGTVINFWHVTPSHTYLYTFMANKTYHKRRVWTEELYRELEADLRSPQPSVKVLRFAVDEKVIFSEDGHEQAPKAPEAPKRPDGWEMHLQREERKKEHDQERKKKRAEIEAEKSQEPAPYILYGTHSKDGKEYAWRLTPDKPKRQGIVPGDRVLVWTKKGFTQAWVTRIEEAGDQEQPAARVKKKLAPGEKVYKYKKNKPVPLEESNE